MKIDKLTIPYVMQLMGSEASRREAEVMLALLLKSPYRDTIDIPVGDFFEMVAKACEILENDPE